MILVLIWLLMMNNYALSVLFYVVNGGLFVFLLNRKATVPLILVVCYIG